MFTSRSLRFSKAEKQLPVLNEHGAGSRRVSGGNCTNIFELEKTIDLLAADKDYNAFCCTITSNPPSQIVVPNYSSSACNAYVFGMDGHVKLTMDTKYEPIPGLPFCAATTPDGHFYITDANPWIRMYDKLGRITSKLPLFGVDMVHSRSEITSGIAIDGNGQIIVGEYGNTTISIYKADRSFVKAFHVDIHPEYITPKSKDVLLLADVNKTDKILEIDYTGNVLYSVPPPLEGVKWNPRGICCSRMGEIFVVNGVKDEGCVCCFSTTWGYTGRVIQDLQDPRGIAISDDGKTLIVVDAGTELKIFRRI